MDVRRRKNSNRPLIKDEATRNALNEDRFGWGASIVDFNNDGLLDIAQANGMVDDTIDKKYDECPDFWYVNEKIARSAPSVHRYVHNWGDIRGFCIYGKELNRLYLNTGAKANTFVDVSEKIGMDYKGNSRGMAAADLNNDGKLDLVVTRQFERQQSIEITCNRSTERGKEMAGFILEGDAKTCNSQGIGRLSFLHTPMTVAKVSQFREAQVVNGFEAQNDSGIHFGIGQHKGPINVTVNWCNGKSQNMRT